LRRDAEDVWQREAAEVAERACSGRRSDERVVHAPVLASYICSNRITLPVVLFLHPLSSVSDTLVSFM
jgi:hypothetical protein